MFNSLKTKVQKCKKLFEFIADSPLQKQLMCVQPFCDKTLIMYLADLIKLMITFVQQIVAMTTMFVKS